MSILRKIERFAKYAFYAPLVIARHGSFRPSRVRIAETGAYIYFNVSDRRAVKKLIYDTARRRVSLPLRFWRDFLHKLQPDVALDVGTNYGECLFGVRYPASTRVLGCEANPELMPHIWRSCESHPDQARIEVANVLVSEVDEVSQYFHVNPTWSGTASIHQPSDADSGEMHSHLLSTRRLDSLLAPEACEDRVILLKMDIEGSEPLAMRGFSKSLEAASLVVGLIEFDTAFMQRVGQDGATFFNYLKSDFDLFYVSSVRLCTLQPISEFGALPISRAEDGRIHLDLVLVTKGAEASAWVPSGWVLSPFPLG